MKINEENFVIRMKLRDEAALCYVIEQYGGLVKSVVRRHLYPDAQSMFFEECVNDIFLGIWQNIDCFEPEKNPVKNWIAGIARFKAIDYGRKYAVIRRHESEEHIDAETVAGISAPDSIDEELSEQMQMLIARLSAQDRELFMRVYVEEIPVADISLETGVDRAVIYNRLSRGRKKLRNLFAVNERGN